MCAITRSGQETEDWLSRLSCLNVKRDRLRAGLIGEDEMNSCEDDMLDRSNSCLQSIRETHGLRPQKSLTPTRQSISGRDREVHAHK